MRCCYTQRTLVVLVILLACTGICITPCMAGTKYFSGGPDLLISLDTGDELVPGTTVTLPLVLENRGTITMEFADQYTMEPQYLPTTAMFCTIRLVKGDAPVKVKSNPRIIGDVQSGMVVPAQFEVEIPQDATAGRYNMQAIVTYQYVPRIEQEGSSDMEYYFKDAETTIPVPVVIRPLVILAVEDVSSERLHAGGEGYVTFTLKNTGQDTGNSTSVYLEPEGASPITPFSNGVFIGELPPGGTADARFKVAVSENADPTQPSPVSLYAVYVDYEGNTVTTPTVSTGVGFGEKVTFISTSPPSVIRPGKTDIVSVTYKNTGNATVYNAQARISVIDPFSSDDDTAYLGDLKPGDSATAIFSIKTDAGATEKTYSVDSEVGYTDMYQTTHTSDNIPVLVEVRPESGLSSLLIGLPVLVIVGAGVVLWYRKKQAAGGT